MLAPTKLSPDDPRLVALGLPRDRDWYRLVARGGGGLPWDVGHPLPRKFDWSAIGTPVDTQEEGIVLLLGMPGAAWHAQLWVQRIGDPREAIYLEARWHPEERSQRVALHGLETNPSDALISALARARGWFAPARRAGDAG